MVSLQQHGYNQDIQEGLSEALVNHGDSHDPRSGSYIGSFHSFFPLKPTSQVEQCLSGCEGGGSLLLSPCPVDTGSTATRTRDLEGPGLRDRGHYLEVGLQQASFTGSNSPDSD